MSYEPTNWQTGEIITAERLNHIENGITSAQVYTESETVRFSGEVTTAESGGYYTAELSCDLSDRPDEVIVTFQGQEYSCPKSYEDGYEVYGSGDYSEYPFAIYPDGSYTFIYTETAGTYQVEIKAINKTVSQELADAFPVMQLISGVTYSDDALAAFNAGKLLYFYYTDTSDGSRTCYMVTGINTSIKRFTFVPENNKLACSYFTPKVEIDLESE